jgi:hypothetical protein
LVRLEYRILTSCLADEVALPIVVIRLVVAGRLIAEALDTAEMVSTLEMIKGVEATVAAEAEVGEIEEEEDHLTPRRISSTAEQRRWIWSRRSWSWSRWQGR